MLGMQETLDRSISSPLPNRRPAQVKALLEAFLRDLAAQAEEFEALQPLAAADGAAGAAGGAAGAGAGGHTAVQALAFVARWRGNVAAGRARVSAAAVFGRVGILPVTDSLWFAHPCAHTHQAAEIKSGLDSFGLPSPPCAELAAMERALDALERMWRVVEEWQGGYAAWKETKFRDIKV
jgi:hypothetical protein